MALIFLDGPIRVFRPMPIARMVDLGVPQADAEQAWRVHQTRKLNEGIAKVQAAVYGDASPVEAVTMHALYLEAIRYDSAGRPANPSPAEYPHIAGREAAARGMTVGEFTDYAIATGQAWATFAAEVRAARAELTAAIAAAPNPEDVSDVVAPGLAALQVAASSL